ncbi:hypothetical protein IE53DRAFT_384389 [Violaceomyces palustris]|uniref:Uncharacterized protein n=1 Tax=Violaceomyces palustris TaxID=1673888 RepID=A0ACD0P534_9BASI|nr:hypothetical protein IE53DRAFT_384389 [Violaceomyces palustris]
MAATFSLLRQQARCLSRSCRFESGSTASKLITAPTCLLLPSTSKLTLPTRFRQGVAREFSTSTASPREAPSAFQPTSPTSSSSSSEQQDFKKRREGLLNNIIESLSPSNYQNSNSNSSSFIRSNGATKPINDHMAYIDELERNFTNRTCFGSSQDPSSSSEGKFSGRSEVRTPLTDAGVTYKRLMATLRRNNVRNELRLVERYEKPNEERRRKKSERHRRRFADMVRKKVQLVMAIKARGA